MPAQGVELTDGHTASQQRPGEILVLRERHALDGTAQQARAAARPQAEHQRAGGAAAREIEEKAKAAGCEIVLPVDGLFAKEFKAHAAHRIDDVAHIHDDEMMLDVGPKTVAHVEAKLAGAKTLVWNGPFGAFEIAPFDTGTVAVAHKAAALTKAGSLVSIAGGGDTVAALNHAGVADDFTYISTAGGAFLEWMEGKALPGVEALRA